MSLSRAEADKQVRGISSPVMRELTPGPARGPRLRQVFDLNQNWQFFRDESASPAAENNGSPHQEWEVVNLPHSVRLEPANASGCRNFQGVCWYRRRLHALPMWADRVIYLHFEGAMQVATVWLNGRRIGEHFCGYTPFVLDISGQFDFAAGVDNELIVRLDNRDNAQVPPGKPQRQLDFTYFGGMYRGVWLEVLDPLHISDPIVANRVAGGGIFVSFPEVTTRAATIEVQTELENRSNEVRNGSVRQDLIDDAGQTVASATVTQALEADSRAIVRASLRVKNPKLWHPNHPHLHKLRTTLRHGASGDVVDERFTHIGIRHIRFDRHRGLFINGENFLSIGANRHQDHPIVGYAVSDAQHWRDARKLREAGFTSVRCHYPQAPAFMDACDELGLLAIDSNPGWQHVGDELFSQRAVENARVMVRRDRNRPSVILWEAALNESDNSALVGELQQAIHEEYPGDQCYTAGDHESSFSKSGAGWDVEYLHNDGSRPYWIREWGDQVDNWSDQQSRNRVARGWGEGPMLVQAMSHLAQMNAILDEAKGATRLAGACLWAGIDYNRGYHHQPFFGGVLDLFRLPKFSYHLFRSQRPPHLRLPGIEDSGPMVFIANFATPHSPLDITVFSNCEEVRLWRGEEFIAIQQPDAGHRVPHPPFTFHVEDSHQPRTTMYMNGASDGCHAVERVARVELRAEGLIAGRVVATHTVRPPGVPAQLVLEADLCGKPLVAGESDWVRVYARVCDAAGTVCPTANDSVRFSCDGEGRIIGDGDSRIHINSMPAELGIATALVRAATSPGKLVVRATAFGLSPAQIEITTVHGASRRC